MAGPSAPRLDYSKPPPGYAVTESCGWWPADDAGELVREDESFDTEADALAVAWAHYKAWHDPPGCSIGLVMKGHGATARGYFVVDWGATQVALLPSYKGKEQQAGAYQRARTAAWALYDRRLALISRLDFGEVMRAPGACGPFWPRCLAWTDEQAAEVEQFLQSPVAPPPGVLADEDEVSP